MKNRAIKGIQSALDRFVQSTSCVEAGINLTIDTDLLTWTSSNDPSVCGRGSYHSREVTIPNEGQLWFVFVFGFEPKDHAIEILIERIHHVLEKLEWEKSHAMMEDKMKIMQTIIDELPEMIAVKNTSEEYIISNRKADQLFKDRFNTIVGQTITNLYGELEKQRVIAFDEETIRHKFAIRKEFEMQSPQGSFLTEAIRIPSFRNDGTLQAIISINRNIQEVKNIQSELRSSLSFQETLIDIAKKFINVHEEHADQAIQDALEMAGTRIQADRVYVFDYDFVNGTTSNTYEWCAPGVTPEIERQQNTPIADIEDLWLKYHRNRELVYIENLEMIDPKEMIYQILAPQSIKSILTIPLFHNSELIGFAGFDATKSIRHWSEDDQKLLQVLAELIVNLKAKIHTSLEIKAQKERAEQFSKVKTQFLTNMSHEIRTPLSGIYSAINLLLGTVISPKQMEYLELAKLSIETLSGIVNDVLDISRIEQGKLSIDLQYICLETEMFQIAKLEELLVMQKGLTFQYDFDFRMKHEVEFDRIRLRQIIINLAHNAIKFTDQGSISISTEIIGDSSTHYDVLFMVNDTGQGIPKDALPYIADAFYQADQTSAKVYQGTGLGLSIVKEILTIFNTRLEIESEVNQGTTIRFVLSLKKGKPLFDHNLLIGKSVIIIQDDATPNDIGIHFYESMGMLAEKIPYEKALSHLKKAYDFVVMELNLDHISLNWIRQIKELTFHPESKLVLCNLIGNAYTDEYLKEKHVDFILNFPLTRKKVMGMFVDHNSDAGDTSNEMTPVMVFNQEPILIVDDNPINLQALSSILEMEGLSVDKANSGKMAIQMIQKKSYLMVFMDIQMPRMDGYETTRNIRELGYDANTLPIVAVTANVLHNSKQLAIDAGMNAYVSKPFKPEKLFELIQQSIKLCDRKTQVNIPAACMAFNDIQLMSLFKNKAYLGEKVISAFFEEYGTILKDLKESLYERNLTKVGQIAHYLKGSASYAAAERIVYLCEEIMKHSKTGDERWVGLLIDKVEPEVQDWIHAVNQWQKETKQ